MQHGQVDMVIVGTDRTTADGDVCNKIGTYLKALAAHDNDVPFYVALPSPTIDWTVHDGVAEIPIEERDGAEVTHVQGKLADGSIGTVQISPDGTLGGNPAFDVTPRRLVTGLITERGVCDATPEALAAMFPEHAQFTFWQFLRVCKLPEPYRSVCAIDVELHEDKFGVWAGIQNAEFSVLLWLDQMGVKLDSNMPMPFPNIHFLDDLDFRPLLIFSVRQVNLLIGYRQR